MSRWNRRIYNTAKVLPASTTSVGVSIGPIATGRSSSSGSGRRVHINIQWIYGLISVGKNGLLTCVFVLYVCAYRRTHVSGRSRGEGHLWALDQRRLPGIGVFFSFCVDSPLLGRWVKASRQSEIEPGAGGGRLVCDQSPDNIARSSSPGSVHPSMDRRILDLVFVHPWPACIDHSLRPTRYPDKTWV